MMGRGTTESLPGASWPGRRGAGVDGAAVTALRRRAPGDCSHWHLWRGTGGGQHRDGVSEVQRFRGFEMEIVEVRMGEGS